MAAVAQGLPLLAGTAKTYRDTKDTDETRLKSRALVGTRIGLPRKRPTLRNSKPPVDVLVPSIFQGYN